MTHVTCRLTAKNRDQLRDPTLGIEYGLPYLFMLVMTIARWGLKLEVIGPYVKGVVRVSTDGNAVGGTSIFGRCDLVF